MTPELTNTNKDLTEDKHGSEDAYNHKLQIQNRMLKLETHWQSSAAGSTKSLY